MFTWVSTSAGVRGLPPPPAVRQVHRVTILSDYLTSEIKYILWAIMYHLMSNYVPVARQLCTRGRCIIALPTREEVHNCPVMLPQPNKLRSIFGNERRAWVLAVSKLMHEPAYLPFDV